MDLAIWAGNGVLGGVCWLGVGKSVTVRAWSWSHMGHDALPTPKCVFAVRMHIKITMVLTKNTSLEVILENS